MGSTEMEEIEPYQQLVMVVAYDGAEFLGWQATPMGRSVEEVLTRAVSTMVGELVKLEAASRTDAGVHAEGQVVACRLRPRYRDMQRWSRGLNALLPQDVRIMKVELLPESFHPTLHVQFKEYQYTLCYGTTLSPLLRRTTWHYPYHLDLNRMRAAVTHLLGTHRFAALANRRNQQDLEDDQRTLYQIKIQELGDDTLRFIVVGDHFLYKMVRNIVGLLLAVGRGKLAPEMIPEILKERDRCHEGITAAAHGLRLKKITYIDPYGI
jgi:tRNA pseudouridine38-40 synthase